MSVIIVRVGEKTFKNILTGHGKLPRLSRNGALEPAINPSEIKYKKLHPNQ